MDTFNIILIALIFVSLVVIIGIFAKNLKKFKETEKQLKAELKLGNKRKEGKKENMFGFIISKTMDFFVWLAEWIVTNAKKILQNAHSGLREVKLKKNGKVSALGEEKKLLKEEVTASFDQDKDKEEDSMVGKETTKDKLKKDISTYSSDKEGSLKEKQQFKERGQSDTASEMVGGHQQEEERQKKQEEKLSDFFTMKESAAHGENENIRNFEEERINKPHEEEVVSFDEETEEKESKKGGFLNKINPFKRQEIVTKKPFLTENSHDQFSDDVTKVNTEESISMMEQHGFQDSPESVPQVRPKKVPKEERGDDALGIDLSILEKKILQKIALNPKDIENYRDLGDLYIKMKNFVDARNAFKFILKVTPRDIDAKNKLDKIKLLKRLK